MQSTLNAFSSAMALKLTEPFPPFLLRDREMRDKTGDLQKVRDAKLGGQKVD
jgi:hypothetical protein